MSRSRIALIICTLGGASIFALTSEYNHANHLEIGLWALLGACVGGFLWLAFDWVLN